MFLRRLSAGSTQMYSTLERDGCGMGVLVAARDGRPIKIEGNPRHPASLGATDPQGQASVLQLWDPDRSMTLRHDGQVSTWEDLVNALGRARNSLQPTAGAGLRLLLSQALRNGRL